MYDFISAMPYWLQVTLLLVPVASLVVATLVFAANAWQAIKKNRLVRAEVVSSHLRALMEDDAMRAVFYEIEYGAFEYDPSSFHGSQKERDVDRLIQHFAGLALMWKNRCCESPGPVSGPVFHLTGRGQQGSAEVLEVS